MLGYVMVGTNNLEKAIIFYDEVLKVLNLERNYKDEVCDTVNAAANFAFNTRKSAAVLLSQKMIGAKQFKNG